MKPVKPSVDPKHQRQVSQHVFGKVRQMAVNADNAHSQSSSDLKRKDSTDQAMNI
jgi:hypothetical protein